MWAASLLPIFCKQTYLMVLSGKSYCFSAALPRQQAVWLQWPQYLLEEAISFDLNRFTEIVSQSASIWLPSPLEFEQNRCELKQTCRRLWACYGAKQGLWFHPLWVSVTWMMTLFSVQFESTKLQGHFEHFRSRSSPVHRATSPGSGNDSFEKIERFNHRWCLLINEASWLCYYVTLCLPMSLIHLRFEHLQESFGIDGLIVNSKLRVQLLPIKFWIIFTWAKIDTNM